MEEETLTLLKANLGISKNNRDTYLISIIQSVLQELEEEKGIELNEKNTIHSMFVVDYAAWRYRSRGEGTFPRNLQFRLHNLIIKYGGNKDGKSTDVG